MENLPVPFDRHVWQQAISLHTAGWDVSIVCPTGPGAESRRESLQGIDIYRHPLPNIGSGAFAYIAEYTTALFFELYYIIVLFCRKRFHVLHACNPPDFILVAAWPLKLLGVKFVYDQHDLAPELFSVRYSSRAVLWILYALERLSFRAADCVLSSNEEFREIAHQRGHKALSSIAVVHTIPDASHLKVVAPNRTLRAGRSKVVGYVGIIGFQDGVDLLVRAVHALVHKLQQHDLRVIIVGDGPALKSVQDLANDLQLDGVVVFTGYLSGLNLWAQMNDFDIGVIPDPPNELNDKLTMNKVFEYSALGIPSVGFKLSSTVSLLGDVATYADSASPLSLARAIAYLLDDDALRKTKSAQAKQLSDARFDWSRESATLVTAYERLT